MTPEERKAWEYAVKRGYVQARPPRCESGEHYWREPAAPGDRCYCGARVVTTHRCACGDAHRVEQLVRGGADEVAVVNGVVNLHTVPEGAGLGAVDEFGYQAWWRP